MTTIHYQDDTITLHHGDCVAVLATLAENSIDAIVTDPPYSLSFMGRGWDTHASPLDFQLWCQEWATECLRVLKPGGHMLAFGGTRTWHRLACAVEDAGFEMRDSIAWLYGSGFPKSLDVSKAIDKAAGAEREVIGLSPHSANRSIDIGYLGTGHSEPERLITAPATDDARQWQGWGTALKPSFEGIVCATKPRPAQGILREIGSHLNRLEVEWSSIAKHAGLTFGPTRPESPAVNPDSVHGNAATPPGGEAARPTATGLAGASFEATGTSTSESMVETFWNIATSWRSCLAELSELMSTSTTETTSVTTIGLQTLSSSISSLTATNTLHHETNPAGLTPLATAVDSLFGAALLNWRAIHALSVVEPATAPTQRLCRGAAERASAFEPIVMARKPLAGTVAANVQQWGTGAINVDGCRIGDGEGVVTFDVYDLGTVTAVKPSGQGRWPANVALDEPMAAVLDQQSGITRDGVAGAKSRGFQTEYVGGERKGDAGLPAAGYGGSGGASRFYFVAKAPSSERPKVDGEAHATVKPLDLMRWLIRLVTPPGGTVLDPFTGSGTTLEAAGLEGFRAVGIEREADYLPLIMQRIRQTPIALFDDGEAS